MIVTTQERLRTELSLNGHDFRGSKCNRENDYTLVVFYLIKEGDRLSKEIYQSRIDQIVKNYKS